MSDIDTLKTLLDKFGLKYDYEEISNRDILAEEEDASAPPYSIFYTTYHLCIEDSNIDFNFDETGAFFNLSRI